MFDGKGIEFSNSTLLPNVYADVLTGRLERVSTLWAAILLTVLMGM